MLILRESYFIYVRNLKTWLAQPWMIVAAVLSSAFMFLFFGEPLRGITALPGFPADDYQAFLAAMVIVMAVVFSGSDMAMVLLTDMMSGYVDKLLLSPVNRFSILLGTLLIGGTRAMEISRCWRSSWWLRPSACASRAACSASWRSSWAPRCWAWRWAAWA